MQNIVLAGISYSDGTPGVTNTYDRRGRVKTVQELGTLRTTTFSYNNAGQVLTEAHSGGLLDAITVTNIYDSLLRRTNNGTAGLQAIYTYGGASRLDTVTQISPLNSQQLKATYGYVDGWSLVGSIAYARDGANKLTTIKQYDSLNRLTNIYSMEAGGERTVSFS